MQIEERNTDFNPNPKTWYRIVNKEKLFENKSFDFKKLKEEENNLRQMFFKKQHPPRGNILKGPVFHAHDDNFTIDCMQISTGVWVQWRFEAIGEGYYKIINRSHEEKSSPKMLNKTNDNKLQFIGGEIGNNVQWKVIKSDEDKDVITPQFYHIVNKAGGALFVNSESYVELSDLDQSDQFKWLFFKEK
jgi:hypothetical protein